MNSAGSKLTSNLENEQSSKDEMEDQDELDQTPMRSEEEVDAEIETVLDRLEELAREKQRYSSNPAPDSSMTSSPPKMPEQAAPSSPPSSAKAPRPPLKLPPLPSRPAR